MRPRLYADLLGFVRAACTHASHAGGELPVLPFYVKEHAVGWIRPSFADLLRRWPHGRDGRSDARPREGGRDPRLARRAGERLAPLRRAGAFAHRARRHAP